MFRNLLIALSPAMLIAGPAMAAPAANINSVVVSFADLDLSRADHLAALEARIYRAAQDVCEQPFFGNSNELAAYDRCVVDAVDRARAKLAELQAGTVLAAR